MQSINPATEEVIGNYSEHSWTQIEAMLTAAQKAFVAWRHTKIGERARLMNSAARVLRKRRDELARLMTDEVGKTLSSSAAEVDKCAGVCEYFAASAEQFL